MNITFPVEMKKARIELFLGPQLQDTYIAVDGKPLPYRSLLIYQEYDRTIFLLDRVVDDMGRVTEETLEKPIQEVLEASPLIIRQSKEGLEWSPDSIKYAPSLQPYQAGAAATEEMSVSDYAKKRQAKT